MFAVDHTDATELDGVAARDYHNPPGNPLAELGFQPLSQEPCALPCADYKDPT